MLGAQEEELARRDGSRASLLPKRAPGRAADALLAPRHRNYRSLSMRSPDDFDEDLLDSLIAEADEEEAAGNEVSAGAAGKLPQRQEAFVPPHGQAPTPVLLQRGASAAPAASGGAADGAEPGALFVGMGASPGAHSSINTLSTHAVSCKCICL
jgi:hypothetical protein